MSAGHRRVAQRGLGHRVGESGGRQRKGCARPLRAPRPKRPPDTSDRPGRKNRGRDQKRKGKARRAARDAPGAPPSPPYAFQDPNVPPTRQIGQGEKTGASEEEKGESGVAITRTLDIDTRTVGGMHDSARIHLNRSLLRKVEEDCGDGWGQGTIATYTKFYVNPPGSQPLPHQRRQATVRPSLSKALGGATISRRYAAGRCADAQNAPRKAQNVSVPALGGRVGLVCDKRLARLEQHVEAV